jgi:hypothetical protein
MEYCVVLKHAWHYIIIVNRELENIFQSALAPVLVYSANSAIKCLLYDT